MREERSTARQGEPVHDCIALAHISQSSTEFFLCAFIADKGKKEKQRRNSSSDISPEPEGEQRFPHQQQRHRAAASSQKHRLKTRPLIESLREMLLVWKDLHKEREMFSGPSTLWVFLISASAGTSVPVASYNNTLIHQDIIANIGRPCY